MAKRKIQENEQILFNGIGPSVGGTTDTAGTAGTAGWFSFEQLQDRESVAKFVSDTFSTLDALIDGKDKSVKKGQTKVDNVVLNTDENIASLLVGAHEDLEVDWHNTLLEQGEVSGTELGNSIEPPETTQAVEVNLPKPEVSGEELGASIKNTETTPTEAIEVTAPRALKVSLPIATGIPAEFKKRAPLTLATPTIEDNASTVSAVAKKNIEDKAKLEVQTDFPYKASAKLMTRAEHTLYTLLTGCLPEWVIVAPKVRIADIIEIDKSANSLPKHLYSITNKHVDFVICDRKTSTIICGIELDDISHQEASRVERDIFVNKLFSAVNTPLIRFGKCIDDITDLDVRPVIMAIYNKYSPHCTKCGVKMTLRSRNNIELTALDDGLFYGCSTFPECRATLSLAYCNIP